jgi:hypothetical protein
VIFCQAGEIGAAAAAGLVAGDRIFPVSAAVAHEIEAKRLGFVQARNALVVAAVVLRVRGGEGRAPDPPTVDESALVTRRGNLPYAGYVKSVTAVKAVMGDAAACTQRLTTR